LSQANIEIAKNCYEAFGRGDIPALLAALAEDVEWITPGEGIPTEGTRRSRAEVGAFFEAVGNTWSFTSFEPREYIASGDTLVVMGRYGGFAKATGKPVASDWVMVWKIRDGKVAYFREFTDTLALANALKT
jgi:ketosteroid isomerase-like protein